jgi:UDP-glucose 4-epimerase
VPYEIVERRAGDVAASWADVTRASEVLDWRTRLTLEDMCADSWRWQQNAR